MAVAEFRRTLAPGGRLFLTVPFGRRQQFGWMQQFDSEGLQGIADAFCGAPVETAFFRYTPEGWIRAAQDECSDLEYFDVHSAGRPAPDLAAAARAVACLEFEKPTGK